MAYSVTYSVTGALREWERYRPETLWATVGNLRPSTEIIGPRRIQGIKLRGFRMIFFDWIYSQGHAWAMMSWWHPPPCEFPGNPCQFHNAVVVRKNAQTHALLPVPMTMCNPPMPWICFLHALSDLFTSIMYTSVHTVSHSMADCA